MLKSLTKTIMSFTGILVVAAVVLFLLFFPAACGKFACGYEPTWWPPFASASSDCPDSLDEAAGALEWASAIHGQLDEFDGRTTGGWLFFGDTEHEGDHVKLWSGVREHDGTADDPLYVKARELVRQHGGWDGAPSHVELKAVAKLIDEQNGRGILVINHPRGPCEGCKATLDRVLRAAGVALTAYWKTTDGTMVQETYPREE